MFRFQQLCLVIVAGFILFLSAACDPALCGDTLIPIDFDDVTKPELYWEVVSFENTDTGPISAITILDEAANSIGMSPNTEMTITLKATDPESGINEMDVTGGFGYFCSVAGGGNTIALDGVFPGNPITFTSNATCATESGSFTDIVIDGPNLCTGMFSELGSGGYGLTGYAENEAGLTTTITLNVSILDL